MPVDLAHRIADSRANPGTAFGTVTKLLLAVLAIGWAVPSTGRAAEPERRSFADGFGETLFLLPDSIDSVFENVDDTGVALFFDYWGIVQGNPVGGLSQEAAYAHEMLFGATFDLAKLAGWKGASLQVSGAANSGRNLSESIGNVFNVAQTYVTPTGMFYELFLEQKLFGDFVEVRLGRVVAADLFASLPAFGIQVTGGLDGNPTSLFLNSNFTSSPNATWGASLKLNFREDLYAAYGIYQASDRLGQVAYHGLDFSIRPDDGVLMFLETGWSPSIGRGGRPGGKSAAATDGLSGIFKVGGYFSTLPVSAYDEGPEEQNTFGFYLLGQQTIWQSASNSNRSFDVWAGATFSPQQSAAQMPWMGFAGTVWSGPLPWREQDQFLCTWLTGGFGTSYADNQVAQGSERPTAETVLDVSYIINLTENIFVQPDIQYIIQPYGLRSTPNALVVGAQFGCTF